jgi:hypothetical protein
VKLFFSGSCSFVLFFSYYLPSTLFSFEIIVILQSYFPMKLLFILFILLLLLSCKVVNFHLLSFYLKLGVTLYDHKNVLAFISHDFNFCDFATFHLLSICLKFRIISYDHVSTLTFVFHEVDFYNIISSLEILFYCSIYVF